MTQEKHQSHELARANSQAGEVMMQIVVKRNGPEQDAIVVKLTKKRRRAQEGGALKELSDWLEIVQKRTGVAVASPSDDETGVKQR